MRSGVLFGRPMAEARTHWFTLNRHGRGQVRALARARLCPADLQRPYDRRFKTVGAQRGASIARATPQLMRRPISTSPVRPVWKIRSNVLWILGYARYN